LCFRSAPDLLPQTLSRRRSRSRILLHPPLLSHILLHPPLLSAAAIPHPRQPATGQAATKVPPTSPSTAGHQVPRSSRPGWAAGLPPALEDKWRKTSRFSAEDEESTGTNAQKQLQPRHACRSGSRPGCWNRAPMPGVVFKQFQKVVRAQLIKSPTDGTFEGIYTSFNKLTG
ncbi:unnamed protein product, partial [Urochloa humidicola]